MNYFSDIARIFEDLWKDAKLLLSNLSDNVYDSFITLFKTLPKDIWRFLRRHWELNDIIWNDSDWDFSPMLHYLKFKIAKTKEHVASHKQHGHWQRDVKNMEKAILLIDKALDDFYYWDECEKKVEAKWGKSIHYREEEPTRHKNLISTHHRREMETYKNYKEVRRDERAFMNKAHRLHKRDWNALWKHLNKHLREWWC